MGEGSFVPGPSGFLPTETVLHVTNVENGSPSATAGLLPEDDFILANQNTGGYEDVEGFGEDFTEAMMRFSRADETSNSLPAPSIMSIFVYRASSDSVRLVPLPVSIAPWKGEDERLHYGLGLVLASGKLHELPEHRMKSDGCAEFEVISTPMKMMSQFLSDEQSLQLYPNHLQSSSASSLSPTLVTQHHHHQQQQQQQQQHTSHVGIASHFGLLHTPLLTNTVSKLTPFGTTKSRSIAPTSVQIR
jgi:hypothetical protein